MVQENVVHDNKKQLVHGSKLFADESNRNEFPAIVIFPQCPKNDYWANVEDGQKHETKSY